MGERFWEIDFLRGTAIIMMIIFHILFDIDFFGYYPMNVQMGFWRYFAIITASIFIFLSGVSLTISYSRKKNFTKHLFRGMKIFGLGMIATLATWLFIGNGFVIFGILHFIGLSVIIGYFLVRFKVINLLLGIIIIILGFGLWTMVFDFPWLLWLGLRPSGFYSIDYFPMLPWFGVFLFGLAFGNRFYPSGKRCFRIMNLQSSLVKDFCFLGRHSLVIYLVHQVIIVSVLWILF